MVKKMRGMSVTMRDSDAHMITENSSSRHGPKDLSGVLSCIGINQLCTAYTHKPIVSLLL